MHFAIFEKIPKTNTKNILPTYVTYTLYIFAQKNRKRRKDYFNFLLRSLSFHLPFVFGHVCLHIYWTTRFHWSPIIGRQNIALNENLYSKIFPFILLQCNWNNQELASSWCSVKFAMQTKRVTVGFVSKVIHDPDPKGKTNIRMKNAKKTEWKKEEQRSLTHWAPNFCFVRIKFLGTMFIGICIMYI